MRNEPDSIDEDPETYIFIYTTRKNNYSIITKIFNNDTNEVRHSI